MDAELKSDLSKLGTVAGFGWWIAVSESFVFGMGLRF
jgi:hypothetical protein